MWRRAFLILTLLCVIGAGSIAVAVLTTNIPSVASLKDRKVIQSTKLYDRTGTVLLYEIYGEEKRTVIPFSDIPRQVKNATIAIEDSGFYSHHGVSPTGILRGFLNPLLNRGEHIQGGSTITQQLVKNTLLTSERTLGRKIKEAILAIKLETAYSKDEILNMYLNQIPYGSNAYGVEAAAETFFGRHASDLTLAESAYLAALPKATYYYSPYGNHRDELEQRKNIVLSRMRELGFIDDGEMASAKSEVVQFLPQEEHGIRAPHFVMYVIDQLNNEFGEEFLRQNGLTVITSLDMQLQTSAEETIKSYAPSIEKNYNAHNAGLVAIDPQTGQVLAMVGSRNYFDTAHDGNFNVAIARRQPGSAFKPIVYATAFKKGYTPETVLFDAETEFAVPGAQSYKPQNYDALFRGPISLREALAQSINIPSVKLLYLAGIKDAIHTAQDLGITTLTDPARYGLTLVLGGGEVRLLDLVSAYSVFANDGVRNEVSTLLRVEAGDGSVIKEYTPAPKEVLNQNVARTISNILSDNVARAPAFGATSALYFPDHAVAVKTGTTNDYRDAWVVGYTPTLAAGVWAGNNDNSPMQKKVAGFIVAPIWHDFMAHALALVPPKDFIPPTPSNATKPILRGIWKGGTTYKIDKISGNLATDKTPLDSVEERVLENIHTILHWVDKTDPTGPLPENPAHDPQYYNWEQGVQNWVRSQGIVLAPNTSMPTAFDTVHTLQNKPVVAILQPAAGESFKHSGQIPVSLSITGPYPIRQIDYFIDNVLRGSQTGSDTNFTIDASSLDPNQENATITIKAYDTVGNKGEQQVEIRLSSA